MYSRYGSPKKATHSFSSKMAVTNRNTDDNNETKNNTIVMFLKNIPQVKKSNEA